MPGGAARGAQARTGSRAPSATFSLTPGTNSGYTLGAASTFGLGASFTFALDPVRSLIFHAVSAPQVTLDQVDCLDALALSHHSGARVYDAGGAETPLWVIPTVSLSLGIISLRRSFPMGRAAAYQHTVPL
jgi:hypothetical protein